MKVIKFRFLTAIYLAAILTFSLLQSACSDKATDMPAPTAQEIKEINSKALETAQLKVKAETEEKGRKLVEKQLKDKTDSEKFYEKAAWILGIVVVFALLIGIAIGSSSRKQANSKNHKID